MKRFFCLLTLGVIFIAAFAPENAAAQNGRPKPLTPAAPKAGLTISLTTSGYQFPQTPLIILSGTPNALTKSSSRSVRRSSDFVLIRAFNASVSLVNHTNNDIAFEFPTAADNESRFVFSVFDSNDTLVWQSDADTAAAQIVTTGTLRARSAWRQQTIVPLTLDGNFLAAGRYTLEARVNGTPEFSATASFEVKETGSGGPSNPPPDLHSGIKGVVVAGPSGGAQLDVQLAAMPMPHAVVHITGPILVPPPRETGALMPDYIGVGGVHIVTADDQGKFQITLPPGKYFASASYPAGTVHPLGANTSSDTAQLNIVIPGYGGQIATVTENQFTEVTLQIDTGIFYPLDSQSAAQ